MLGYSKKKEKKNNLKTATSIVSLQTVLPIASMFILKQWT